MANFEVRDAKSKKPVVSTGLFTKETAIVAAEEQKAANPKANYEVVQIKIIHMTSDVVASALDGF